MAARPTNIGIKAIEVFFPKSYILQDDLEERDIEVLGEEKRQQIKGKYTKGLGQTALAFCTDREDTVQWKADTSQFQLFHAVKNC